MRNVAPTRRAVLAGLSALPLARARAAIPPPDTFVVRSSNFEGTVPESAAYKWMDVALVSTANDVLAFGPRPTVGSRNFGILTMAIYDAWAAYDPTAQGMMSGRLLARPAEERTQENKQKAVSYAAYAALNDLYPADAERHAAALRGMGYEPGRASGDARTPEGIGTLVATAITRDRHGDGANQLGDEVGGSGKPYSDWTDYRPLNTADTVVDPNYWQPIRFDNGKPGGLILDSLSPHWYRVKPFALDRSDQFRPATPPRIGSAQLRDEADQVLAMNAALTPDQKALVEFMRDGPSSTAQAGHWMSFAQAVSRRDGYGLDQDVKLFFVTCATAMEAFIASWDAKRHYDSSRPWTLIHTYYAGKRIRAWGGPGKGTVEMNGEEWHPFSPYNFITPPFAGFVSGHSTVSAACGEALRLFTGSDHFGETVILNGGAMTEPGAPTTRVTLDLPTFTETGEKAGLSRLYGGYHIMVDNLAGLTLGRQVAAVVYKRCTSLIAGTPDTRPLAL